jgi:hypothetical protein
VNWPTTEGPSTVTCRVLKLYRQHYNRWLEESVSDRKLAAAWLANAVFDAHRDDPEFGYRFLADEARNGGLFAYDRTVWRHCEAYGWWSRFGKKRTGKTTKPGTPPTTTSSAGSSPPNARTSCG